MTLHNSKDSETYLFAHACSCFDFGYCLHLKLFFISLFCHTGEHFITICRIWCSAGLGIMTSWFHCKNMINMSGRSTLHTCVGSLFLRSFLSHHSFPSRQQNVAESFSSSTPPCPQLRLLANWRTGMIKSWSTLTKRRWATSEVLYWSQRGNGKLCV